MHIDYRAMKAANHAQVADVNGEIMLRRQYFDRGGQAEPIREDVITVGYLAKEINRLVDELDDIKAMGADFAIASDISIEELRTLIQQATQGL